MNGLRASLRRGALPVLAVVALAGYLLVSHHGTAHPKAVEGQLKVVSAGGLLLEYPSSWQPSGSAPDLPGLKIGGAHVLAPGGDSATAGLLSGRFPSDGASPLPAAFLSLVHGVPHVEVVNLTHVQAYRFSHLRGYERSLDVYTIPAVGGIQTALVCYAASSAQAYLSQCESIAATVTLVGLTPFELSPNERYAGKLAALIESLNAERATLRQKISSSEAPARLSALASILAGRLAASAASLALLEAPQAASAAQTALVSALQDVHDRYGVLSRAAVEGPSAYEEAKTSVEGAETRVEQALRNFALLAYGHT